MNLIKLFGNCAIFWCADVKKKKNENHFSP